MMSLFYYRQAALIQRVPAAVADQTWWILKLFNNAAPTEKLIWLPLTVAENNTTWAGKDSERSNSALLLSDISELTHKYQEKGKKSVNIAMLRATFETDVST